MLHEHIRCGVALFPPNWVDLELAAYAETLGFDALWIGEHIAFHIPTFDALTRLRTREDVARLRGVEI